MMSQELTLPAAPKSSISAARVEELARSQGLLKSGTRVFGVAVFGRSAGSTEFLLDCHPHPVRVSIDDGLL